MNAPDLAAYRRGFGERLRHQRRRRGLTQAELADLLGVDRTTLTHVEAGRNCLTLPQVSRLLLLWNVDAHHLITGTFEPTNRD